VDVREGRIVCRTGVAMTERLLRGAIGLVAVGVVLIVAWPLVLYACGLSVIPAGRLAARPAPVPDAAYAALWASLGGSGEPALDRTGPYDLAMVVLFSPPGDVLAGHGAAQRLSALAGRALLAGYEPRSGMFRWHIPFAAASIWVGRNWTAREAAAAVLRTMYFGHGLSGLDAAAMGYFGVPAEQLADEQIAVLVATTEAPNRLDPWCHAERNRAAVAQLSPGLPDTPPPGLLPAPAGACEK